MTYMYDNWLVTLGTGGRITRTVVLDEATKEYLDDVQEQMEAGVKALYVIALDPKIRAHLEANDPNALAQVEDAILDMTGEFNGPEEGE